MTNNFEATGYHTYTAFKWMDCGYFSLSCYVFVYFSLFVDSHQKRKVGNKNNILTPFVVLLFGRETNALICEEDEHGKYVFH